MRQTYNAKTTDIVYTGLQEDYSFSKEESNRRYNRKKRKKTKEDKIKTTDLLYCPVCNRCWQLPLLDEPTTYWFYGSWLRTSETKVKKCKVCEEKDD